MEAPALSLAAAAASSSAPFLSGAVALIVVASVLASVYHRGRMLGFEDRFMALYGKDDWEASNMELTLSFSEDGDGSVTERLLDRIRQHVTDTSLTSSMLHETAEVHNGKLEFVHKPLASADELLRPRRGVWFKFSEGPGKIIVVWSHIQCDGLRLWQTLKPLFDQNPHILSFAGHKTPPPLLPEIVALPRTIRSFRYSKNLKPKPRVGVDKRFEMWSTQPIKEMKRELGGSFNLVATSMLVYELFRCHRDTERLTVGLTVAFPFMKAKNTYGVCTLSVNRGGFIDVYAQVLKQMRGPLNVWGVFANQSLALSLMPDRLFLKALSASRGKIDVLISNLPVGKLDVEIAGTPISVACHCNELTVPYYFLLLGTKSHVHLSCTSKYELPKDFMNQNRIMERIAEDSGKA